MRNMMLITIRAYKSFKRMTSIRLLVQCHPFDVLTKLRWGLQDFFKGSKGQGVGPMHIPQTFKSRNNASQ